MTAKACIIIVTGKFPRVVVITVIVAAAVVVTVVAVGGVSTVQATGRALVGGGGLP